MPKQPESEQNAIDDVVKRLSAKHPDVDTKRIRQLAQHEYDVLQHAKLRDYIPVLVEHAVKQDLKKDRGRS